MRFIYNFYLLIDANVAEKLGKLDYPTEIAIQLMFFKVVNNLIHWSSAYRIIRCKNGKNLMSDYYAGNVREIVNLKKDVFIGHIVF